MKNLPILILTFLLTSACAAENDRERTDEAADRESTMALDEGYYCVGTTTEDFPFDVFFLRFDGGSEGRRDMGTAHMVGSLQRGESPSDPSTRFFMAADYAADWEMNTIEFRPTRCFEYNESNGEVVELECGDPQVYERYGYTSPMFFPVAMDERFIVGDSVFLFNSTNLCDNQRYEGALFDFIDSGTLPELVEEDETE